jgi:hypothetical protein
MMIILHYITILIDWIGYTIGGGSNAGSGSERGPPSSNAGSTYANNNHGAPGRAVFGIPLEQALGIAQIANLPAIVFRCIEYLEAKKAAEEEGIYRLSGSSAVIKALKDRFNHGKFLRDFYCVARALMTFLFD